MDRRKFLESLFAVGIATAIDVDKAIEQCLIETVNMTDRDFIEYVKLGINMYMLNPAQYMIINGEE